ncbi:DUF397 domain-containing protein [Actinomadura roseirufa]|uniref:DUF397 domain-containing protein n=1 Tax=Actinomadura roseirufa TaxID=2094049 RepID=UPI0010412637|nr:DUF397 domain-containing protein [Actinomadura roseirufa]
MTESNDWPETTYQCNGGGCVMVERIAGCVVIWDSKNPYGQRHVFSEREYAEFRRRVQDDGSGPESPTRLSRFTARVAQFVRLLLG